jgi:hypothetical protein
MHRPATIAILAAATLALGAAPAGAAVTVAGAPPGATLTVEDARDNGADALKLELIGPNEGGTSAEDFTTGDTEPPPLWPDEVRVASEDLSDLDDDKTTRILVGGAVNAAAASVELKWADRPELLRLPTLDGGAYQGRHADQVRFFLGEITLPQRDIDDDDVQVRVFDAAGAVIGIHDSPDQTQRVDLAQRRVAGARIRFDAVLKSQVAPLPGAPEHRAEGVCLNVAVNPPSGDLEAGCDDPYFPMSIGGRRGCGPVPTTLAGFVPAATSALVVTLGSGRVVRLPTRAAPFGRPGRIVTAILPPGEAIRRAVAVDAGGHELTGGEVRAPPPDRRCERPLTTDLLESWSLLTDPPKAQVGTPTGTEVAAVSATGRRLLVRDAGENLCIGIDRLTFDDRDCGPPPYNSHDDYLYVNPKANLVAGVYAAPVSAVDLHFRDGGTLRIPASEGVSYTGHYRSVVRFAFASTPPGRIVTRGVLFDAAGRVIGRATAEGPIDNDTVVRPPRTVLRSGDARVVAGAVGSLLSPRVFACFGVMLGRERNDCQDYDFGHSSVTAVVPCATRQTILFGLSRPRGVVSRVQIHLTDGRTIEPRFADFPSGTQSRARLWLAVLPRDVAVTHVHFARKHKAGDSDNIVVPSQPPARQCGYEWSQTLF